MAVKESFKNLNLNNAFLFAAAMEDKEICGLVLECILGHHIEVEKVIPEKMTLFSSDFRYARFDVFATDIVKVTYNLEMQNRNEGDLSKRSRYHQAEIDVTSLESGQNYCDLPPVYIIFICNFDPFGKGKCVYTFEMMCNAEEPFALEDGAKRVFLNTKGKDTANVPKTLIHFLQYVNNSTDHYVKIIHDKRIDRIHEKITKLKHNRTLEDNYMYLKEMLSNEKQEGMKDGQEKILSLIRLMTQNGQEKEIPRLSEDEKFFEKMLRKYQLFK
ncbi:MAG: Rpn family recombination-promoting nuclease/putative transposase [Lachnospiraceae bacterium]|nr:Rpn family recombination-promoting nuclease/putative transposase [Lachnospiraceae bacterium]